MANRKLGIHIAPGALKLIELEQQGKSFILSKYSIDYFPLETDREALSKILITALKKNHIHEKQADIVVSSGDIVYKLIELPPMPEKESVAALDYKLNALLPATFKENVFAYYKLENVSKSEKQMYFIAAAPKEKLQEIIKLTKKSGIAIKGVISPSSALGNYLTVPGLPAAVVVYLGKYYSVVVLIKEGQGVFAREIKIGSDDINQSMTGTVVTEQGKLEIDYNRAEEIKNKFGIPINLEQYSAEAGVPAAEILAMMRPALEKIALEIGNTFEYYQKEIGDNTEFRKIYFTGGGAATKNLIEYFRLQYNFDAEILPININVVEEKAKESLPILSMAIGAVLAEKDRLILVPKAEDRLFMGNLTSLLGKVLNSLKGYIFATCLFLMVLAGLYYWVAGQKNNLDVQRRDLQTQYLNAVAELSKKVETGRGLVDLSKFKGNDRFAILMSSLNSVTPGDVSLMSLNYEDKTNQLIIRGILPRDNRKISLPAFMNNLAKHQLISNIELISIKESETYSMPTYFFELTCGLATGESK